MPTNQLSDAALEQIEHTIIRVLSEYATPAAEFLNTQQAAKYVGLSEEYLEIARHRKDGSGPDYVKLPKAVRYRRSDLDAWMEAHRAELPILPKPRVRAKQSA